MEYNATKFVVKVQLDKKSQHIKSSPCVVYQNSEKSTCKRNKHMISDNCDHDILQPNKEPFGGGGVPNKEFLQHGEFDKKFMTI